MAGDDGSAAFEVEPEGSPGNHKAWAEAAKGLINDGKKSAEEVRKAVQVLEALEANRIAAQIVERRRQAALAAAAEERRKREAQRRLEEEIKRQQAADLKARHQEAEAGKRAEHAALKAATANFHRAIQSENDYREKWKQIVAMRDAAKHLGNANVHGAHSAKMKFGIMMVCEMRLKMRDEKPQEESFRDAVHEALQAEWQTLNKSREELMDWARQGEECRNEMLRVEALLITGPSRENVKARQERVPSLPALATTSLLAAPSTEELLAQTYELVARAHKLTEAAEECIFRTEDECSAAAAHTSACLDKRKNETDVVRRNMDKVRKEAKATVTDAQKRISLLKMRAHKTPETPRSAADTHVQLSAAGDLIMQLQAGRRRIDADYRLKTSSFRIDKSCRELTKIRAGTHVSCISPVNLGGSQSSPNLTAG